MGKFFDYIGAQCGNPNGIVGRIMTWGMNRANRPMYKGILNEVNVNPDSSLLEIGFGNGYLIKQIYKKSKCYIFGIDISEDMMEIAKKKNQSGVEAGNIKLSLGDCCQLDYKDGSFDVVVTMNTIYFWNDTLKGLKEIHRTLKNDGIFYNAVLKKEALKKVPYTQNVFKFFDKEDYINLGKQAGFSDVVIKELPNKLSYLIVYLK